MDLRLALLALALLLPLVAEVTGPAGWIAISTTGLWTAMRWLLTIGFVWAFLGVAWQLWTWVRRFRNPRP